MVISVHLLNQVVVSGGASCFINNNLLCAWLSFDCVTASLAPDSLGKAPLSFFIARTPTCICTVFMKYWQALGIMVRAFNPSTREEVAGNL